MTRVVAVALEQETTNSTEYECEKKNVGATDQSRYAVRQTA